MSAPNSLLQLPLIQTLAVALCGALTGLGVWVAVAALNDWLPHRSSEAGAANWLAVRLPPGRQRQLAAIGVLVAVVAAIVVQLPVVALLVMSAVLVGVDLLGGPSMDQVNRIGAGIAAWSETVRQELEAGQPQRAALIASCDLAPPGLEQELSTLALRLETSSVPDALWAFARDVDHPAAGHVVAALDVAYRYGAADLPRLMAGQVETTRHQVQMAREIHAARAKHRRAMVLLLALFFLVIVALFVLWPEFLAAYRGVRGQLVLATIGGAVLVAVRSLIRLVQPTATPNFFTGSPS